MTVDTNAAENIGQEAHAGISGLQLYANTLEPDLAAFPTDYNGFRIIICFVFYIRRRSIS